MADLTATVAILTFNGEKYLDRILEAVLGQELAGGFDVLVIDSGSTDGTLAIVGRHPDVRLHTIPNSEFGHGRTRNVAAALSRGRFTAYLTHDAVPLTPHWLENLVRPMIDDDRVAGVLGKQVPRPRCVPMQKYEIERVFAHAGPPDKVSIYVAHDRQSPSELAHASFYSDVNSAARTDVLRHRVPYRDVDYAEDQFYGRDILAAGLAKAYAPNAAVEHSNDLRLRDYGPRLFDETVALRRLGVMATKPLGAVNVVARSAKGAIKDTLSILRDRTLTWPERFKWWFVNPLFHLAKWWAIRAASRVSLEDETAMAKSSLESRRRAT